MKIEVEIGIGHPAYCRNETESCIFLNSYNNECNLFTCPDDVTSPKSLKTDDWNGFVMRCADCLLKEFQK